MGEKPTLRQTHTYVELSVPKEVFEYVWIKLDEAGYQHALDEKEKAIDMQGLALVPEPSSTRYRSLDDVIRIRQLEAALADIWEAYGVVVSNSNGVSGVVERHLVPAIKYAKTLLPKPIGD